MSRENYTEFRVFIFVGFSEIPEIQHLLFAVFLCIYLTSVLGNASLILVYKFSPDLNSPMYFYLANFSFLEIFYISATVPNMLSGLLAKHNTISFYGCAIQMYCFILLGGTECYMLAAMAYDRYNAICNPLLYSTIMKQRVCIQHIVGSWVIGAVNSLIHTILTFRLTFCNTNKINHFFCDIPPVMELACTDTWVNELVLLVACGCVIVCSFLITMFSYVHIISAVLKIHSTVGRKKTFSTCTSHLIVVCLFYGSAIFMYFRPKSSYVMDQDRLISAMYAVVAPLINPFIYSLRNSNVKVAIKKIVFRTIIVQTY
ncbi:olfactory receptor 5AR1-like [Pelodytes ibericus]